MTMGIYLIRCKVNDKIYIGRAINIEDRKGVHLWKLRKGIHINPRLQKDFLDFGESNFEFNIIQKIKNREELAFAEMKWIVRKKPEYNGLSYGTLGYHHAKETKVKISEGNKKSKQQKIGEDK